MIIIIIIVVIMIIAIISVIDIIVNATVNLHFGLARPALAISSLSREPVQTGLRKTDSIRPISLLRLSPLRLLD